MCMYIIRANKPNIAAVYMQDHQYILYSPSSPMPGQPCKRPKVDPTVVGESKTLDTLLQLVGSGGTCIHTAAELARAFQQDAQFSVHEGLKKLASCGNSGLSAQNGERDFRRFTRGAYGMELEPYTI